MRMTTRSRYAVRALVNLALKPPDEPVSLAVVAGEEDISLNFLEQIFMSLRKQGLVRATRGPAGGYALARPPAAISVGEVIEAVGEPVFPVRCGGEEGTSHCERFDSCITRQAWQELGESISRFLMGLTLADIIGRGLSEEPAAPAH